MPPERTLLRPAAPSVQTAVTPPYARGISVDQMGNRDAERNSGAVESCPDKAKFRLCCGVQKVGLFGPVDGTVNKTFIERAVIITLNSALAALSTASRKLLLVCSLYALLFARA